MYPEKRHPCDFLFFFGSSLACCFCVGFAFVAIVVVVVVISKCAVRIFAIWMSLCFVYLI